jgi:hypothetical protein
MSTNDFYWDSEIGQWVHAVKRSVVSPTPSAGQHTSTPAITKEQQQTMLALCYQLAAEHERLRLRGTWSESLADQPGCTVKAIQPRQCVTLSSLPNWPGGIGSRTTLCPSNPPAKVR